MFDLSTCTLCAFMAFCNGPAWFAPSCVDYLVLTWRGFSPEVHLPQSPSGWLGLGSGTVRARFGQLVFTNVFFTFACFYLVWTFGGSGMVRARFGRGSGKGRFCLFSNFWRCSKSWYCLFSNFWQRSSSWHLPCNFWLSPLAISTCFPVHINFPFNFLFFLHGSCEENENGTHFKNQPFKAL